MNSKLVKTVTRQVAYIQCNGRITYKTVARQITPAVVYRVTYCCRKQHNNMHEKIIYCLLLKVLEAQKDLIFRKKIYLARLGFEPATFGLLVRR